MQKQRTISQSDCHMWWKVDFIQQPVMMSSVVGPRSTQALPKAKLAPKKVMVTVWWSAPYRIHTAFFFFPHTAFWILVKPSHLRRMLSKSMRCTKTTTSVASIGQQNGPNSLLQCLNTHCTTNASKVEQTGLRSFASSTTFTWPLAKQLPLLEATQLFAGCFHNQQEAENAKSSSNPEAHIFML